MANYKLIFVFVKSLCLTVALNLHCLSTTFLLNTLCLCVNPAKGSDVRYSFHNLLFIALCLCVIAPAHAEQSGAFTPDSQGRAERLSLAKSFVSLLKPRLSKVEREFKRLNGGVQKNILPDGEALLLQPVLGGKYKIKPDSIIFAEVYNQKVLLSFKDVISALRLGITFDEQKKTAQGWYLREDKNFSLDANERSVQSDLGDFVMSENVLVRDDDVFVPMDELATWFGFDVSLKTSLQELSIQTDPPLPIVRRYARENAQERETYKVPDVELPLGGEPNQALGQPVVDVSTNSTFRKSGNRGDTVLRHNASVRTASDLAGGTLATQSALNDTDFLTSVRAQYKKESLDGDLFGPLKARRFELGDITTVNTPLGGGVSQELGVRLTNTDKLRGFSNPLTEISGSAIPNWDVELYRGTQFIGFQRIMDDGFYAFKNVDLFQDDNNFRLVFYGPQGERREESVFIPYDRDLISKGAGIYDVSVSLDGKNTYNKNGGANTTDEGSVKLAALYERPIARGVTGTVGLRSHEDDGERNTVVNTGLSINAAQTLLNLGVAVDDEAEVLASLTARRDFGQHEVSNTLSWAGAGFDRQRNASTAVSGSAENGSFNNQLRINGPLVAGGMFKPYYNITSDYNVIEGGGYTHNTSAGLSAGWRNLTANGTLDHYTGSGVTEDSLTAALSVFAASYNNRLRLTTNYNVQPTKELRDIVASYNRRLTDKTDLQFDINKNQLSSITDYRARLDWQAGFARISPSISYNTNDDFFAGLTTRFGVVKEPSTEQLEFFDHSITNFGIVSAFVFLDKDGDGVFNGDDEALKDVEVFAPQNGGRQVTDEHGLALFSRLSRLKLTDIYVVSKTLQDPTWIAGFEGVSILPREGYVAEVQFPIHRAGELDGALYANVVQKPDEGLETGVNTAQPVAIRDVLLSLYNDKGEVEQSVRTDLTGFYYFPQIPPGRYLLTIDEKSAKSKNIIRPVPQQIEIGYDGTIIYGNTIYVDTGKGDVPSDVLVNLDDMKIQHPHIDFDDKSQDVVLNLGEYNSRLLMSVVWYKLKSRFGSVLAGTDLFVPPAQSFADAETGQHTLRVGLNSSKIDDAYNRCRALMQQDQFCKVEIFPTALKHAKADVLVE